MTHTMGIDVETRSKRNLIRRLNNLKTTIHARDGGEYHEDRSYSQIWLKTELTMDQVETWLYNLKGDYTDYIGCFLIEDEKPKKDLIPPANYSVTWRSRWSIYFRTCYIYAPLCVSPENIIKKVEGVYTPFCAISPFCLDRVDQAERLPVHYCIGYDWRSEHGND